MQEVMQQTDVFESHRKQLERCRVFLDMAEKADFFSERNSRWEEIHEAGFLRQHAKEKAELYRQMSNRLFKAYREALLKLYNS